MNNINDIKNARNRMIDYLKLRLEMKDWHGIRDACTDIEVLEGKIAFITATASHDKGKV